MRPRNEILPDFRVRPVGRGSAGVVDHEPDDHGQERRGRKTMRSDFGELCFSVLIPVLFAILVAVLIMAAPSVDEILKNY